ncbi:hypothetical protein FOTG_03966 [Fusarium oxysporum f. sp. vasinfectum 25433]|uniref:Uncharacterized protein n=1 Tax=Fusarium oxysporum f. sp. vasinfectum 25433 TaxID=1089449 RepID=X0NEU3_FUSOX|nr:hypothetical protein FOTG_03966 [Fusarium oxysporum f. sp. vasinfectum 25433]EXM31138.1 hypothetical protein FOTG_03966 [Fusarium oxysporum f. sp. vasinfectum 25433]EXM31139.1 hypothetical protein FOTG_03966 [Fusarium oxysporum f. sp. vasinfectum 25433]EXM31140.1 hypothetical protein FOTG_03966 [Fusarium oxysporum f. sp. vasinfectum 25433]EXM31141.1 hypothetical protein FOTG_03966 [Fusarium oxysporum f. sp. vasinfectum 25433]
MRCCQPPAATLRVFEANCCCFYFCCAFLPSFLPLLYCTALHSRFLRCTVPSLSTFSKPDSISKERVSKYGRTGPVGIACRIPEIQSVPYLTVRQIERDTYLGTSLDIHSGQPPSASLHNFIPCRLHEELLV